MKSHLRVLGLLTGASPFIPPSSVPARVLSMVRAVSRPPHRGASIHRTIIQPIAPAWGMRQRLVHLIRHHPRTRRVRTVLAVLPNVAVVRLAAKNVLLEKAPKHLMSMSFVLVHFVQALIHSCMKSPGSSSFQGSLEDGSCDHDIAYNLGPPARKSSSSDCP